MTTKHKQAIDDMRHLLADIETEIDCEGEKSQIVSGLRDLINEALRLQYEIENA